MKKLLLILFAFSSISLSAQITEEDGKNWAKENKITLQNDGMQYIGKANFAAPIIKTRDGGLAITGSYSEGGTKGVKVVFLNDKKEVMWSHFFGSKNDNLEPQSIIEDRTGHFYIFMEAHDKQDNMATRERVIKLDGLGNIEWDYALERKEEHYHRHCVYVKLDEDGKHLVLFGTVQPDKMAIESNEHYSWQAKLDGNGKLNHEIGELLKD